MPEFSHTDLLPLGPDTTEYRLLREAGVAKRAAFGREFLEVEPEALTLLTAQAMRDIAHLLRPAHLRQFASTYFGPNAGQPLPLKLEHERAKKEGGSSLSRRRGKWASNGIPPSLYSPVPSRMLI